MVSNISSTIEDVREDHIKIKEEIDTDVIERIRRIRFNIGRGRDQIRNYPISAGEYNSKTSMELRIPEAPYGPSTQTRVSFDVSTEQDDALLLFMGDFKEYLAFQVSNGKLQIISGNPDGTSSTVDTGIDINAEKDKWKSVKFER